MLTLQVLSRAAVPTPPLTLFRKYFAARPEEDSLSQRIRGPLALTKDGPCES